jgi:Uma2 family endonuclease
MATLTRLKLGPKDHGRAVSLEEFDAAEFEPGWDYEYISGRIDVSPAPNFFHDRLDRWLFRILDRYSQAHPEVAREVSYHARVHLPDQPEETCPEPDIAVYQEFPPPDAEPDDCDWRKVSPILVVEVVSPDSADKDFNRNVKLYRQVPSIREYWILDQRPDARQPSLHVYKRGRGLRWKKPVVVPFGATYTTDLLPGFELVIDPARR